MFNTFSVHLPLIMLYLGDRREYEKEEQTYVSAKECSA